MGDINLGRKRKKKTPAKSISSISPEMAIILMLLIGVMLGVLIYTGAGQVGAFLSPLFGGLVGVIKYVIPIGIIVTALSLIREESSYVTTKLTQFIIFIICITTIMHINQFSKMNIASNATFEEIVNEAYKIGTMNQGGGAIGAIVATPLTNMLGSLGAMILTIAIAVVTFMYIVGINPIELMIDFIDSREERKEERRERREEERQAYNEKREERRKNRKAQLEDELKNKKGKEVADKKEQVDLIQDEIVINHFNDREESNEKKSKFSLFNKNKNEESAAMPEKSGNNPEELENIFKEVQEEKEEKTKAVLQLEHQTHTIDDENYEMPPVELLAQGSGKTAKGSKKALTDTATKLQKTLYSFGVSAKVENVSVGPVITRYELKPAEGVRVSKIAKLSDDIALNLAAESIRIEAPIPGKQAVGIEIPNKEKESVPIRDIIDSDEFKNSKSKLSFALGKNVSGENIIADIAKMPHVLIAGSTGSGKSVCINTLITSILYKAKPSEVKLIMVDPKVVELSVYNGIPHLLIPVVTDPKKAAGALAWAVQEMVNRYSLFAKKNVRDIKGYNAALQKEGNEETMPQIVIIVDELADLMMVSPKDVEDAICRLAQMARAAGMHLVIATQRPSVDVITGIIKANIPSRIAFAVSSQVDSRTILDGSGAEKLLGKGDMLFYPSGASKATRVQGAFISDGDVEKIVDFLKRDGETVYNEDILETIEKANTSDRDLESENSEDDEADPFLAEAIEAVIEIGSASASLIQRRFKVGYARAGRIIDQMEARGIISGYQGSKPREVLMSKERWQELKMSPSGNSNETD
ncbi:MAG: DNA translocase FtsK 4TM domain-containing protein [Clostridia bacterium]|nr:DNA translocase FtsK 4TM domain-containing protein [Clostridia bacterium]